MDHTEDKESSRADECDSPDCEVGITEDQESESAGESDVGSAVQLDSEMDITATREPGSANESDSLDPDSMDDSYSDYLTLAVGDTSVGNSSKWCSTCRFVAWRMIKGMECPPLGTWQEIQSRAGCPSCDDILSPASRLKPENSEQQLDLLRMGSDCSYIVGPTTERRTWMAPLDRTIESDSMGVAVDPNWFDVARLKRWLAFCDENHGDECHALPRRHNSVPTTPRYLIDIEHGCLVEQHGGERYFALSYVWGDQQTAGMATKGNIESLKVTGAIAVTNTAFKLPRTVEDAIQLTQMLEERFLWVDRLCIVQDDIENWHSQINKMGSIYANAYCTFVASEGSHADHGISGLNKISGPRQLPPRASLSFPSLQTIEVHPSPPAMNSAWNKRGWTFQELKLSRRALFFNSDVRWACQQSTWQEDRTAEPEGIGTMSNGSLGFLGLVKVETWPNFAQWGNLIFSHCKRDFRFECETGAAFAGIEEILSHSFSGGFCFGMPEFYFDIALLWWPLFPLQRRVSESKAPFSLPSWSFLGWKEGSPCRPDGVGFACEWLSIMEPGIRLRLCSTSSIVPKVQWTQQRPSGQERRIRNDYHIWKERQEQKPLEAHARLGWQKNGSDWTHSKIPSQRFRYPVPIGFKTVEDTYRTWPPSLRLRSQNTFLTVSRVCEERSNPNWCFCVDLVTYEKKWAGILHLNTNEEESIPFGGRCELISLSHGSVSNDDEAAHVWLEEWDLDGRPKECERYEFYNVMWIRREDTYVVREGIGRVERSVWDSQDLEEIDMELR